MIHSEVVVELFVVHKPTKEAGRGLSEFVNVARVYIGGHKCSVVVQSLVSIGY